MRITQYQIEGIEADGNCFFNAFLKSYYQLQIPTENDLIAGEANKTLFLRQLVVNPILETDPNRWVNSDEGGKSLANFFHIPVRVVTANTGEKHGEASDLLIFPDSSDNNIPNQEWENIPVNEQPNKYIFIVDVAHHFLWANVVKFMSGAR